jgi:hypothetical protein
MTAAADAYRSGDTTTAFNWMDRDIFYGPVQAQTITSFSGTTLTKNSHGLTNGTGVVFTDVASTNLQTETEYYIVSAAANTFSISATSGGSAITVTGSGTLTIAKLGSETQLLAKNHYMVPYQAAADLYSPAKRVTLYEAGYQGGPAISTAHCTSLGISTNYGGTVSSVFGRGGYVYDMVIAYKNSHKFYSTVKRHIDQFKAVSPNGIPSWYVSSGAGGNTMPNDTATIAADYPWSLVETDLYGSSQVFKSFDAMRLYATSKRRFRLLG